jgi:hypothetical protein
MKLPDNKIWTQLNNGDILGLLHESQNITLDSEGKVRLSKRAFNRYNSGDDADLGYVMSIVYYSGQYFVLTDDNAFLTDFGGTTTTEITLTADTGTNSDAVVCYDRVYISTNDNLDYYDGSLNASNYATTANVPHPMTVFDSQTTYKLAIGDDNVVHLLKNDHTTSGTDLTLPEQYQVTSLAYRNGYLYVGTKHTNGGEAKVFVWNGDTTNADFEIPTGASWVYSIIPYQTSVAFATNMGQLFVVSGNAPVPVAQFPVYSHPDAIWDDGSNVTYVGKILHRGMVSVGDTIYLSVTGTIDAGDVPEMKSGIWVFDPRVGLYHRASSTLDRSVAEAVSSLSSNTLTLSTHNLKTGDVLMFQNIGSLTGVQANTKYYVSVESATEVKLAVSRKALQAGDTLTIGGTVTSSSVRYVPNTDWGCLYDTSSVQGAISVINPEEAIFVGWESPVIWGARVDDYDQNALYGVYSLTSAWNIGSVVTQRIYASNIKEVFKKLYAYIDGNHLDNEEIVFKYKVGNSHGYPTTIYQGTWGSATTIASVSASQDEDEWADLEVGDELTIVNGTGRGYTTHITDISVTGSDYTITVDESIGNNTKAVYFRADKFKKLQATGNENPHDDLIEVELGSVKSTWIQLKMELRGYETEVAVLDLTTSTDKSAV